MNMYDMPENIRALLDLTTRQEDWPAPEALLKPMPPVPPLTRDMLPKVLSDVVFDEAERMSCAADFVATPMLVAIGAVIGATVNIRPKRHDSWSVPPNIWGAIVGLPGSKKSAAINAGVSNVYRLNRLAQERHAQEASMANMKRQNSDQQVKTLERKIKQAEADLKKARTGTPEEMADAQRELKILEYQLSEQKAQNFDAPPLQRFFTTDATIESVGILASENPRGLLVLQDELMALLTSFEKPGRESDRQAYLTGWNGNQSQHIDRVSRSSLYIENFSISVMGGIQPDVFQSYMALAGTGTSNDGLIQRMQVLVIPDPVTGQDIVDKSPDRAAADALRKVFDFLDAGLHLQYAKTDSYGGPPFFQFDDEAQPLFFEWLKYNEQKVVDLGSGMLAQHLNKYPKLVAALALIFHLVEVAGNGVKNKGAVGKQALVKAMRFAEYLEAHARRVYSLAATAKLRSAHALAAKIESQELQGQFGTRHVTRKCWSGLTEKEELETAFAELEAACWIRKVTPERATGAGGRPPSPKYEINPKIFELSKPDCALPKPPKSPSRRKRA